jgi:hypothetical protein
MPHPRFRRAFALLIGLAASAAFTSAPAPGGTDVTSSRASGTAPIEILGNPSPPNGADSAPRTMDAGVAFENHATTPATSIDFTYLFIDANGAAVGEEHTSTRGRFAPQVAIEGDRAASAHFPGYASGSVLYVGDQDTNIYEPIEHIVVSVDDATFADGSKWQGKTRDSSASPPQTTHDPSADAAHIRILRITSQRANSLYDRVDTALSFANDNEKRIDAIQFAYTFYDRDGNVIQHQTALARGAYPHGAISTLNPSTRITFRGVVMDGGSVWLGWGDSAQYVARITASVDAMRFADGTIWTSPPPG